MGLAAIALGAPLAVSTSPDSVGIVTFTGVVANGSNPAIGLSAAGLVA
jgi:hypothetical protein